MSDSGRWATVTQTSPLRVRLDGEATALSVTPDSLTGPLAVGARVWVQLVGQGVVHGAMGGGGAWATYTPLLRAATTHPNLGTAPTVEGAYTIVGKTLFWRASLAPGGTGVSAGSGMYFLWSLGVLLGAAFVPVGTSVIIGTGYLYGATGFKSFTIHNNAGALMRTDNNTYVEHTVGMTAAGAGHAFVASGFYQIP